MDGSERSEVGVYGRWCRRGLEVGGLDATTSARAWFRRGFSLEPRTECDFPVVDRADARGRRTFVPSDYALTDVVTMFLSPA